MSRFVRPETTLLQISDGDWLLVRTRLSAGEQREGHARMYTFFEKGGRQLDLLQVGLATITTYLLDWSLKDDHGNQVVIREQPLEVLEAAVNALSPEDFDEVKQAIQQHEDRQHAARELEKKTRAGAPTSSPTSPSPHTSVLERTPDASPTSMPMSTA
jgi:hypothetical protein